jgi:hypothetical protein
MRIQIVPFTPEWVSAVQAFNARLRAANDRALQFPESPLCRWLPRKTADDSLFREHYIALDGGDVRGGYLLKHQDFMVAGERRSVCLFQGPMSEGVIDKRFALVGLRLLLDATKRNPLLAALGIGGYEESFTKMLISAKWQTAELPFFFRVIDVSKFLRNITHLRTTRWRRIFFDVLSATGVGGPPLKSYHWLRDRSRNAGGRLTAEVQAGFGNWSDELWNEVGSQHSLVAVRDAATLERLYPETDRRFVRIRIADGTATVGWVVVMNNQQTAHKHFGAMRLGSIVDGLARCGHESDLVRAATRFLIADGADLIVTNQAHESWRSALDLNGYIRGPSNFLFAASVGLSRELEPFDRSVECLHLTRGDGDGPVHL